MPLYRAKFERINFSISPPAKQTADVVFETDIPFENESLETFEESMWTAMWEQNPHWKAPAGPKCLPSGWSSVFGGREVELVPDLATLSFAWHIPSQAWLKADGVATTVDVDEAGRVAAPELVKLQERYPGERYPMVMANKVLDAYNEDGTPHTFSPFQLRKDLYVLWGYGARPPGHGLNLTAPNVSPASMPSGIAGIKLDFKLSRHGPDAQEYERKVSWAWRLFPDQGWQLASSPEVAEEAARKYALKEMRSTGSHPCSLWLAIKHRREVVDATVAQVKEA